MRRRHFLRTNLGLAAGAAALTMNDQARAGAAPSRTRRTYLLIHGAWHSSLHWARVVRLLSARGHRVVAIDLPGHGLSARFPRAYLTGDRAAFAAEVSPQKDIRLDDGADVVLAALRELQGESRPIVVGHSMGGTVITRVGERAPELVGRLVYLSAYCPVRRGPPSAYGQLPEAKQLHFDGLMLGDPAKTGVVRIDPRGDARYRDTLHAAFYHDVPAEEFLAFALALTPDLPLGYWTTEVGATKERWGRVPRTYIRLTEDRALPIALQDLMIREADAWTPDNRFDRKTLKTSHSPFASAPEALTALLHELP
ncbi:Alpha/beta hydrolase family protein [Nannocystis exedens]|uniref:Alpha/beta hydrolase family protein n=1 Tax=Nannocystis exedens TaxID=54 RepID=A0A1I1ZD37_9BACT|nr:alpha/beta fold hydrolase [Nannocystis exedens]PCC75038.1 salicylate esterase [Nannocystis exedens]SFE29502.1 Alpha/beta hydrolase family protein [Nannocystis exedens]